MPVTTPQFLMADRLAGGELAAILRRDREEGKTFDEITRDLYTAHGIVVTPQTASNWCDTLGIPKRPRGWRTKWFRAEDGAA